jgi:ribose 5-phosphate isomerase B
MKIYFATDHAGYELKNTLLAYVRDELGYEVEDCGAHTYDQDDDYPDFVSVAAEAVSTNPLGRMAIVLGASGQGEAVVANKFPNVRAGVFYGEPSHPQVDAAHTALSLVESLRVHNNANVLSIGARFVTSDEAKNAVRIFLSTDFSGDERHKRRIQKIP